MTLSNTRGEDWHVWLLKNWRRRRILERATLPDALWNSTLGSLPLLQGLGTDDLARLRELATLFLNEKTFEAAQGFVLTPSRRLAIAVQACLPILNLDLDWYEGWSALVIYPGEFIPQYEEMDEDGLVHVRHEPHSGESWQFGPVILSWEDVAFSGAREGYNVVIHEMAHKIDMLNGDSNGYPPLHRDMNAARWAEVFGAAYADLNARLDADEDTDIDPYAAEHPGEFFAVMTEYFFELPHLVRQQYPALYRELCAFYRQDPAARLAPVEFVRGLCRRST